MARALYPTVISPAFTTPSNFVASLALGITTLAQHTLTTNLACVGLSAVGGNVDGMVVTFQNLSTSFGLTFVHQSGLCPVLADRFINTGNTSVGSAAGGAIWYRYNGTLQRWVHIGST